MLVSPTRETAGDLHIFKQTGRLVFCVFGDPAQSNDSENLLLDDGAGARDMCRLLQGSEKPLPGACCAAPRAINRGRDDALDCITPPSEPDGRFSRIRLSS